MKVKIYTDGGARGNPGPAGIGVVIYNSAGKVIDQHKRYIGQTTNNQAEYQAIVSGLNKAKEIGATDVECFLDSELVVRQLNGEYKVKDKDLAGQFIKVWNLKNAFKQISFKHIPRENNILADRLVNEAIDQHES